jgi:hypothetical protein
VLCINGRAGCTECEARMEFLRVRGLQPFWIHAATHYKDRPLRLGNEGQDYNLGLGRRRLEVLSCADIVRKGPNTGRGRGRIMDDETFSHSRAMNDHGPDIVRPIAISWRIGRTSDFLMINPARSRA